MAKNPRDDEREREEEERENARRQRAGQKSAEQQERPKAKYKASSTLYVDGNLIKKDQTFFSDQPPGLKWIPVDKAAKDAVGGRPVQDRAGRVLPNVEKAEEDAKKDEEAFKAPHRGKAAAAESGQSGHKRASPGKSVTQQQTDGEEPTMGYIHDNED